MSAPWPRARRGARTRPAGWAGAALIVASGLLARAGVGDVPRAALPREEPLVAVLAPLGPVRSLAAAALWVDLLDQERRGDSARVAGRARALLELQPDLDVVREHLATQLMLTEAARAADPRRRAALVREGLALLEEGLERRDSPALHAALGRLLVLQAGRPGFLRTAEAWFGAGLGDVALEHLLRAGDDPDDRLLAGDLLVERGLDAAWRGEGALVAETLRRAEDVLAPVRAAGQGALVDRLLAPLREWQAQGGPVRPARDADQADDEP